MKQYYNIQPQFRYPVQQPPKRGCSMGHAFTLFWTHYVDFLGTSSRAEYWWIHLWELIIYGGLTLFVTLFDFRGLANAISKPKGSGTFFPLVSMFLTIGIFALMMWIFFIATAIPLWSNRVRRFNDVGMPIWASLLLVFIRPVFYWLPNLFKINSKIGDIFTIIYCILVLASFIFELLPTGTFHRNQPTVVTPYGNYYPNSPNPNNFFPNNNMAQPNQMLGYGPNPNHNQAYSQPNNAYKQGPGPYGR